jgi:tetratricopeptide (TPR) repeat protein
MTNAVSIQQSTQSGSRKAGQARFQMQAEMQLLACLAYAGQRAILEAFLKSGDDGVASTVHSYYLALVLARAGEIEEALSLLRGVVAADSDHYPARRLAYRLIIQCAETAARDANWQVLPDLIAEAMRICPEGEDPSADFAQFRGALPLSHLRAGQREESAHLWEQQLIENPEDTHVIHNLALMHYWWARSVAQSAETSAVARFWQPAITYWSVLQQMDSFWSSWKGRREKVWGFAVTDEDLGKLRTRLLEERFDHDFHNRMCDARQTGQEALAKQYEECLNVSLLERRSAQCWKRALLLCDTSDGMVLPWVKGADAQQSDSATDSGSQHLPIGLLRLPGGIGFFRKFGLLAEVGRVALKLSEMPGAEECAAQLRILFSPNDLGRAFVLIEDRGLSVEAIVLLDQLPATVKASEEALYLRCLALGDRAEQLFSRGSFSSAFDCWKDAFGQLGTVQGSLSVSRTFAPLLKTLRTSIQAQVVSAALKEAKRLSSATKLDEAISVLEQARQMDKDGALLDQLCILLCERAGEGLGQKRHKDARRDFSRVLELKPGYDRAKRGMATIYNNEGCSEQNHDKAIALFEKALEWEPDSHHVKENLARELRGKAVDRVNNSSQYGTRSAVDDAISLLERAFNMVNTELKPGALDLISMLSETDTSLVTTLMSNINNELLKRIVEDLGTVYHMRTRIRRGY